MRLFRRNRATASAVGPRRAGGSGPGGIPPELLERVRAIEIRARRLVNDLFLGEYLAVFRGRGIEFDELRPYVPGDDTRDIDWKTSARHAAPYIRRYREDRDLTVIFAVDVSASQGAGVLPRTKADLAAELCAVFALAAIRNKDRVGVLLFASQPERYVRPQGGATHVLRVVREVLWAQPATAGTNIGEALHYLNGVQKRRATVFLVSDFLTEGYERELRAAARRHDIIAIRVREPRDESLPDAGIIRVRDAESGEAAEIDSSDVRTREAYRDYVRSLDFERRRLFGAVGIDEIRVMVGEDYVRALRQFFRRRAVA